MFCGLLRAPRARRHDAAEQRFCKGPTASSGDKSSPPSNYGASLAPRAARPDDLLVDGVLQRARRCTRVARLASRYSVHESSAPCNTGSRFAHLGVEAARGSSHACITAMLHRGEGHVEPPEACLLDFSALFFQLREGILSTSPVATTRYAPVVAPANGCAFVNRS